jgi:hypothetical protein
MYTIVDDGDEINIRATITQRWELAELVTKLQQRVDGMPVNITTPMSGGTGSGVTASVIVEDGAVTSIGNAFQSTEGYDKIDVNQREQDHE